MPEVCRTDTDNLSTKTLTLYPHRNRIGVVASARIVLILPDELVKSLNSLAKRKGLSRASYIRMALTEHVDSESEPTFATALRSPRSLARYIRESASDEKAS